MSRQKARSLAPLNGLACAVKICHDETLEDTNSLDGAHLYLNFDNLKIKVFIYEGYFRLKCLLMGFLPHLKQKGKINRMNSLSN